MIKYYIIGSMICFFLSIIIYPIFISFIKKIKFGKIIREEGPKSHFSKKGTPSMGGVVFILFTILGFILNLIFIDDIFISNKIIVLILLTIIGFGLIGFIDDFLLVKSSKKKGLSPNFKLILQVIISVIYFSFYLKMDFNTTINFFNLFSINLGFLYGMFILFYLTGYSNAVNLTDGLDGLASGLTLICLIFFGIISYYQNELLILNFIVCFFTSIVAFLFFNFNPAKIFMGDSGSLAIGGVLASLAVLLNVEVYFIILSIPFLIEVVSVILQVAYFKYTKGKRIFLMTPFHHHLELKGWKEKKIVLFFYSIGILCLLITLFIYKISY